MIRALYPDRINFRSRPGSILLMEFQSTFANVILDLKARELKDRLFSYLVPADLAPQVFAGAQVLVPFGKTGSTAGYVVSLSHSHPKGIKPKEILEIIDSEPLFDSEYVDFLNWIGEYYCASLADVVSAAVPSFLTPRIKRKIKLIGSLPQTSKDQFIQRFIEILQASKNGSLSTLTLRQRWRQATGANQAQFYRTLSLLKAEKLVESVPEKGAVAAPKRTKSVLLKSQESLPPQHQRIVDILSRNGGEMPLKELIGQARTTAKTLEKLAQAQVLAIAEQETLRDPLKHLYKKNNGVLASNFDLSADQQKVHAILSNELMKQLTNGNGKNEQTTIPWLLHGVTGSGKTEIYLRLIETTIRQGKSALLLVPEIGLTPQLANRLTERFGEVVAVWHSALSQGERYDTWRRLKSGAVRVLLGARSAVLVDIPDLKLVILDEEHDSSFKQTSPSPRYHAKEVAIEKARRHGALVLLGSATPDVAAYYDIAKEKRVLNLPNRIFNQAFPATITVDMREEFTKGNRSIFSGTLMRALEDTLARQEQSILLINRRGYASHVFCRVCGYVALCNNCSVALVYHQKIEHKGRHQDLGHLACHHCGFTSAMLDECPSCLSQFIKQYGLGTQRVEEELFKQLPSARVLRLDSDTVARRGAHEKILNQFAKHQADVLIGTQMVAKGLDIEAVTLVGILAADSAFNMPDYRSTERGFQLLTQVSGRAGRGQREGIVVLQTYNADMPALNWSKTQDYQSLYENEIQARQEFDYPPFSQLLRIVIAADDPLTAERTLEQLAESLSHYLDELLPVASIKILGPAPCLFERLRGKYRMHLLIKNQAGREGQKIITSFLAGKHFQEGVLMAVDVDAVDLF